MRLSLFSWPLFFVFSITAQVLFSAPAAPVNLAVAAPKEPKQISAIVSGSACPQKQSKKINLNLDGELLTVPMDYEVNFQSDGRKTCQTRLTLNPGPNKQYTIKVVSQNLLFNLDKQMELDAELSFGFVGGQEFKINQSVKESGEYRRFLVKKIIGYATPCGKESMFRLQSDIKFQGKGAASLKTEPMELTIELKRFEAPLS